MSGLRAVFDKARVEERAVLLGYVPAGFPSRDGALDVAAAMIESGCDVIEVGLPYSDPLIDGPTIQAAVNRALTAGTRISDVFRTVETVADHGATAVVMTYWNPVERYGLERFASDLTTAGGVGVITPDLTPEEAEPWLSTATNAGLDPVFLVAPSSADDRIAKVAAVSKGFVYAASTMGVTGTRAELGDHAVGLVQRTRRYTDLPVAVGLGVSSGEQAATVASFADGVIVGSAFVQRLLDAHGEGEGLDAVRTLAADLAEGVRKSSRGTR